MTIDKQSPPPSPFDRPSLHRHVDLLPLLLLGGEEALVVTAREVGQLALHLLIVAEPGRVERAVVDRLADGAPRLPLVAAVGEAASSSDRLHIFERLLNPFISSPEL